MLHRFNICAILFSLLSIWPFDSRHSVFAKVVDSPTATDFPYGHNSERQKLDFWKAQTDKPAPVVIMIHGGGWVRGDKSSYDENSVKPFLDAGISVVRINYRFIDQAMQQGVDPPVKACLYDAARALQTVRSKSKEWNLDPNRIGATGGSAGACTALWLALHDDLANAKSTDPVSRQSTRLQCAALDAAQTSLDPKQLRAWIPNAEYAGHAFGFRGEGRSRKQEFDLLLASREKLLPLIREYSPIEWASHDDPPIYLDYTRNSSPAQLGKPQPDPTHSAINGIMLAEKLKQLGVETVVSYKGQEDKRYGSIQAFLIQKLAAR